MNTAKHKMGLIQCTEWDNGLIVENKIEDQIENWYGEGRGDHRMIWLTREQIDALPEFAG